MLSHHLQIGIHVDDHLGPCRRGPEDVDACREIVYRYPSASRPFGYWWYFQRGQYFVPGEEGRGGSVDQVREVVGIRCGKRSLLRLLLRHMLRRCRGLPVKTILLSPIDAASHPLTGADNTIVTLLAILLISFDAMLLGIVQPHGDQQHAPVLIHAIASHCPVTRIPRQAQDGHADDEPRHDVQPIQLGQLFRFVGEGRPCVVQVALAQDNELLEEGYAVELSLDFDGE